jgi:hypothetical protein
MPRDGAHERCGALAYDAGQRRGLARPWLNSQQATFRWRCCSSERTHISISAHADPKRGRLRGVRVGWMWAVDERSIRAWIANRVGSGSAADQGRSDTRPPGGWHMTLCRRAPESRARG